MSRSSKNINFSLIIISWLFLLLSSCFADYPEEPTPEPVPEPSDYFKIAAGRSHSFRKKICILALFLQTIGMISAQKMIILNDSLTANAEAQEIDVEYPRNQYQKFSIGDYTVISDNDVKETNMVTKERLLGLRVVTKISKTFSFTIHDQQSERAEVITEEKSRVNAYYPNEVLENFIVDEITGEKFESFAAWITIDGDTSTGWVMYTPKVRGKEGLFPISMLLTDGTRHIQLASVSSDLHFDYTHPIKSLRMIPSMGVEFYENEKSIGALQYDSGAANYVNSASQHSFGCIAWMHQNLDAKTHLVLAAAMSTIILMYNPYLAMTD